MNQFWQISGIILWVFLIGYILLRMIYGKKWKLKVGGNFFLGSGLMGAAKQLTEEVNQADIKKETLTEVAVHIFWRLTKIGIFGILLAFIPFILLFQQNKLITKQNTKIDIQNNLIEAERRSSLVFLMSNVLDKVDDEIKEQRIKFNELKVPRDRMRFSLSNSLIARTAALSRAFKPYRMLEGDTLSNELVSPERGQLFIALMESQLDSFTQNSIAKKGDFSNAIIGMVDLKGVSFFKDAYFANANLSKADLSISNLTKANLSKADLSYAKLNNSIFEGTNFNEANLRYAQLLYSKFNYAKFFKANLSNTSFNRADLSNAILRYADLSSAKLGEAQLIKADLAMANLTGANLSSTNFTNANLSNTNFTRAIFKNAILTDVRNLTVEQLRQARFLYQCKDLPPEIESQLRKEKPCLFTKEGCSIK